MNVAELIALLGTLPQDMPVGYLNECAENGTDFITVDFAEIKSQATYGGHGPEGLPKTGAVVLS